MRLQRHPAAGMQMPLNPLAAAFQPRPTAPPAKAPADPLKAILQLIDRDFAAVNRLITEQLQSPVALIEEIGRYIVESGGKRLRPALVLFAARCCNYQGGHHVTLAAIIEFLHTATLLHDDVGGPLGIAARAHHRKLPLGQRTLGVGWGLSVLPLLPAHDQARRQRRFDDSWPTPPT